jgi:arginyl-tRNA synthetase
MSATHARITAAVRSALDTIGAGEVAAVVDPSARADFGDWSTPAPLRAARVLRRPPLAIAEELCAALAASPVDGVRGWSVSKPGYVNAHLDEAVWAPQVITDAIALDVVSPVAMPHPPLAGMTLVEHTAINTNKAAHVGHLRNACLGDTVGRILRRTGHQVEINNYIDDTGVQVADVVLGVRDLGFEQRAGEPFDQYCSRVYVEVRRRYDAEPSLVQQRDAILHDIEARANPTAAYVKELAKRIVGAHLATMRRFDIGYDLLTWESDILELGFWKRAFELLRESGAAVFADSGRNRGCWVMHITDDPDSGDDEAKVLVKSDGVATYTAKDIAYQLWKFGLLGIDFHYRPWDPDDPGTPLTTTVVSGGDERRGYGAASRVVLVLDARQAYLQQIVRSALRRLGHETEAVNSVHLDYEVVALSRAAAGELGVDLEDGRARYALSGRRGIEVRADDVLDRTVDRVREKARDEETARMLAVGAVRYYLQRFTLNQIITFDFDEATRTTGDTGVYIQYAHARASGILRRVPDDGMALVTPPQLDPVERALLQQVDGYALALAEAADALAPNVLTAYTFSLASALSDFYEHTPPIVREQDAEVRRFRRALVAATRATLADALSTLGIAAPEVI